MDKCSRRAIVPQLPPNACKIIRLVLGDLLAIHRGGVSKKRKGLKVCYRSFEMDPILETARTRLTKNSNLTQRLIRVPERVPARFVLLSKKVNGR